MNKQEFIRELRKELQDIPLKEREEAVQYYEEYFDEAGEENEETVIRELGSPARIAAMIKRDSISLDEAEIAEEMEESASSYTNTGGESSAWEQGAHTDTGSRQYTDGYAHYERAAGGESLKDKANEFFSGENKGIKIVIAIILCVALLPVLADVAGVIFGLAVAVVVIVAVPFIVGASLVIAMVSVMATLLVTIPAIGVYGLICAEGICLMILSVGIVLMVAGIELLRHAIPHMWDAGVKLVKWCSGKCQELFA